MGWKLALITGLRGRTRQAKLTITFEPNKNVETGRCPFEINGRSVGSSLYSVQAAQNGRICKRYSGLRYLNLAHSFCWLVYARRQNKVTAANSVEVDGQEFEPKNSCYMKAVMGSGRGGVIEGAVRFRATAADKS